MKKYTVESHDFTIIGSVFASNVNAALQTAKAVYPHVIAPMVYEEVKK